jgi:hypothetical protein
MSGDAHAGAKHGGAEKKKKKTLGTHNLAKVYPHRLSLRSGVLALLGTRRSSRGGHHCFLPGRLRKVWQCRF